MAESSLPWIGEPGLDRHPPMVFDGEGKEIKIILPEDEEGVEDELLVKNA